MAQLGEYLENKKPFSWHWGNSMYLEWHSTANGRVVIESASYRLTVSAEATWEMTAAEEEQQRSRNMEAFGNFLHLAAAAAGAEQDDTAKTDRPQTEAEAEEMQADSDRLSDRIMARMAREGTGADFEAIVSDEVERARRERGDPELTPEQEAERDRWIEEANAAAEEAVRERDAELWKKSTGEEKEDHPLVVRSFKLATRMQAEVEERGWIPDEASSEHPVVELIGRVASAGAKLAGALGGEDWPPPLDFCAGALVRLKRAAEYLQDAQRAAESCRDEALVDPQWLGEVGAETAALVAGTEAVIAELRARLTQGF